VATSAVIKTARDGSLVVNDGTGTPLTITIARVTDFNATAFSPSGKEHVALYSRGELVGLRHTDTSQYTGSFTAWFTHFTAATGTSVFERGGKTGYFASAVSTSAGIGDVMTYNMIYTAEGTAFSDASDHTATFSRVAFTCDFTEAMEGSSVSVSFTAYGGVVFA